MATEGFQRARTDEQRALRRAAILAEASSMLTDGTRVVDLSLNELARRVGLAKSNVLRYFETREAVLLDLLAAEYDSWLDAADTGLAALRPHTRAEAQAMTKVQRSATRARIEQVSDVLAGTITERPVLSELVATAQLVLEQNVSADVAARYKRTAVAQAFRLIELLETQIGPLSQRSKITLAGGINIAIGGIWGLCRPSPGMTAAYQQHPELAALRLDQRAALHQILATMLTGTLARNDTPH